MKCPRMLLFPLFLITAVGQATSLQKSKKWTLSRENKLHRNANIVISFTNKNLYKTASIIDDNFSTKGDDDASQPDINVAEESEKIKNDDTTGKERTKKTGKTSGKAGKADETSGNDKTNETLGKAEKSDETTGKNKRKLPNIDTLLRLRKMLKDAPASAWSYGQFKNLNDLYLSKEVIDRGIETRGLFSKQAIVSQLQKAIRGEDVSLYVIGESVSVGAELGRDNTKMVFHYALANWWNQTVGAVTGSKMARRVIAVGGVSSRYFEKCLQEYVAVNDTFDMILWEFSINDGTLGEQELEVTLHRLIAKLFRAYARVDLVFTVFYDKNFFDRQAQAGNKHKREHTVSENVILDTAYQYSLTSLNIETFVRDTTFSVGEKEMVNGIHPSVLAHAQMALLLIKYYTVVMIEALDDILRGEPRSSLRLSLDDLEQVDDNPTCWTAVTPDFNNARLTHTLFDLPANMTSGFMRVMRAWQDVPEQRVDYTAGYMSRLQNETLTIAFKIVGGRRKVFVAYRIEDNKCRSTIEVRGDAENETIVVPKKGSFESALQITYAAMQVAYVGTFLEGPYTLTVKTIQGGIIFCSIIIT